MILKQFIRGNNNGIKYVCKFNLKKLMLYNLVTSIYTILLTYSIIM